MGRGYFCATVGEIIKNYIANQFNEDKDEIFRIDE